ncbi:MAG: Ser-Thr-rich GPI-anchored membrane family protein [bacterium]|nr:Ser-Thr-rich GPI-anchored membrane family protein [bacterium]
MYWLISLIFSVVGGVQGNLGMEPPKTPLMFVSPETQTGLPVGSTFMDSICISGIVSPDTLVGWEFSLYFDNEVIRCDSAKEGPFLQQGGETWWIDNAFRPWRSYALLACVCWIGNPGVTGSGTVCYLYWTVVKDGASMLALKDVKLANPDAQSIPCDPVDGWYNTTAATPRIMVTWPYCDRYWLRGCCNGGIKWVSTSVTGNVDIELWKGGSLSYTIASNTSNDGDESWDAPSDCTPGSDYKVKISSCSEPSVYDYSNGKLWIGRQLKIIAPNGGEVWWAGESNTITWTTAGTDTNVRLWYTPDGGAQWTEIISSTLDDGSYLWTVPDSPTIRAKVKIWDVASPSEEEGDAIHHPNLDRSDFCFTIAKSPGIVVMCPNGGEFFAIDSTRNIIWDSRGINGDVKIDLYKWGSYDITITESTPNDGSYSWTIPTSCSPDTTYRIKIASVSTPSVYDFSNANFAISEQIQLLFPNGDTTLYVDRIYTIKWTPVGLSGYVKLWYSTNGGSTWWYINYSKDDGSYSWRVPNTPTTQGRVKVADYYHASNWDQSDTDFTIALIGVEACPSTKIDYSLESYPTPFTQFTVISYQLPVASIRDPASSIQLTIYDLTGKLIRSLTNKLTNQLTNSVIWDGTDNNGNRLPSGIYFCKLFTESCGQAGNESITKQLLLLR